MKTWLVVGDPGNWVIAIKNRVWGVRGTPRHTKIWHAISEGDQVLFYATRPVSGIIGMGKVISKFRDESPLWSKEYADGHAVWPHRFGIEVGAVLPYSHWEAERLDFDAIRAVVHRGFQRLGDDLADEVVTGIRKTKGMAHTALDV